LKKQAEKIQRIGLIGNSQKSPFARTLQMAAKLVHASGRQVFSEPSTAQLSGIKAKVCPDVATLSRAVDLLLVFGGDGTMLRVAREIDGSNTPILGINIGGLGFLTAVPSTDLSNGLKKIWRGEYTYESRDLIEAGVMIDGELFQRRAFNDFVVARGNGSRLIELEVGVNGVPVTRYRCDGLIISSPTGSTAYSLAAGGAVADPSAEVFQITPICPHTLTNRSLILPLKAVIEVKVISPEPPTILSADGQVVSELSAGDAITIRRSRKAVRLMQLNGNSFFKTLRQKLHWRGANL
jgi:NAD+ kinase